MARALSAHECRSLWRCPATPEVAAQRRSAGGSAPLRQGTGAPADSAWRTSRQRPTLGALGAVWTFPPGPQLPQTTSLRLLNLSLGGGAGVAVAGLSLGSRLVGGGPPGSWEKAAIHSFPEGHHLGGSCYPRGKPAASPTPVLPFNPSQSEPEGLSVQARGRPAADQQPLRVRRRLSLAARGVAVQLSDILGRDPQGSRTRSSSLSLKPEAFVGGNRVRTE